MLSRFLGTGIGHGQSRQSFKDINDVLAEQVAFQTALESNEDEADYIGTGNGASPNANIELGERELDEDERDAGNSSSSSGSESDSNSELEYSELG